MNLKDMPNDEVSYCGINHYLWKRTYEVLSRLLASFSI